MMAALPYALSVHHFISQVGDYVGFAAIIAVAIMVLLLFAHARETAALRRRAEYAEDELAVLHERVEWLRGAQRTGGVPQAGGAPGVTPAPGAAGAGGVPAPVPPPASAGTARLATGAGVASATSAGGGGGVAPVPAPASAARRTVVLGAPVGVGAPALSSATKLIPPTDEELRSVAAGAGASTGATSEALAAAGSAGRGDLGAAVVAPPAPPPATAAAGGNGTPSRRTGIAADPGAPRGAGRAGEPGGVTSPRRNYGAGTERPGRRRISRTLIAALILLVAAIVVVAVIVLNGGSNKTHNATADSTQTASATHRAKDSGKKGKAGNVTVNINPAAVTVAVLNGTTTANLAAAVSDKLSAKGFEQGTTADAADQSMPTTIVGYVPSVSGAKNDAYAVANTLGLKQTAVKPVSAANQTVACMNEPTSCPDQVIVTVGADLNSDAA